MHPNKKDTEASHERKLRAMTEDYGEANSSMNQLASVDKYKAEGPEEHVGFGADSDRPNLHAARRIRKPAGGNAFATYKRGGRVKHRDGGGAIGPGGGEPSSHGNGTMTNPGPVKMGQKDPTVSSEPSPTPVDNRAHGGRTKHKKGGTHVNIMIAPQHGAPGAAGQPPISALPTPPMPPGGPKPPMMPPPGPPMGGPPAGAGGLPPVLPPGAAPPGAMPPGLVAKPPILPPRKHGGRCMTRTRKHDDAHEDASMIKAMVKHSALKPHGAMRAAGGRMFHLTGGSQSGEGRLEKAHQQKRIAPQKV